jgi:hypothetical protein
MVEQTHDEQIADLREQIDSLKSNMATAYGQWLDASAPVLGEYWQARAEAIALDQSEHTQSLDPKDLQRLKGLVNNDAANARAIAEQVMVTDQPEMWPHLAEGYGRPDDAPYMRFRDHSEFDFDPKGSPPRFADGLLDDAFDHVNDHLDEAGYGRPGYRVQVEDKRVWTPAMEDSISRYGDLHEKLIKAQDRLEEVERDKERSAAKDLWDQA